MNFKKIVSSVVGSGFVFGCGSALLSVLAYSLAMPQRYADPIVAAALLSALIATLFFVELKKGQDNFYRLFIASVLTFLCFTGGIILYFKFRFVMVEGEWLTLLALGVGTCFVFSVIAKALRAKETK